MAHIHHHLHLINYTLILVIAGLSLRYWIGKRRFKRRTIAGLQQFTNYRNAVFTLGWEKVVRWIGGLLIGAGIILYLID